MLRRFFSVCGISLAAFIACLPTESLNANSNARLFSDEPIELQLQEEGALHASLERCPCKNRQDD